MYFTDNAQVAAFSLRRFNVGTYFLIGWFRLITAFIFSWITFHARVHFYWDIIASNAINRWTNSTLFFVVLTLYSGCLLKIMQTTSYNIVWWNGSKTHIFVVIANFAVRWIWIGGAIWILRWITNQTSFHVGLDITFWFCAHFKLVTPFTVDFFLFIGQVTDTTLKGNQQNRGSHEWFINENICW